ncbi:hypothetical protein TNCV_527001 [Trichonephila clavipes]|nr:hypothetical protein TNCV_527001 [Trichonephila clavipes]
MKGMMSSGIKGDNKRKEIHLLDVKHVYNTNNTSQPEVRNAATSDCYTNCESVVPLGHHLAVTGRRRIVGRVQTNPVR